MKPRPFLYERVTTMEMALGLLHDHAGGARVIAGGQSLVAMMNLRLVSPAILVDVGGIEALRGIAVVDGMLRIGAMTRHREIETSDLVATHAPLLRHAVQYVAHQAVRNRGTFGGSLCHADPAAEFPACAVLLDAVMEVGSVKGTRDIPAASFFQGPFTTALAEDEMLLAVRIPPASPGVRFAFHEHARRKGDFALSGVAARAMIGDRGAVSDWVAFGVGDRPTVLPALSRLNALGATAHAEAIEEAVAQDLAGSVQDDETGRFKIILTADLVRRCVADLSAAGNA